MHRNFQKLILIFNSKAQALPYFLVMAMILVLSWAMTVNIAKVIRDRMILQNSVDNTVLSVANLQARTLNLLGMTNYLMAELLSVSSYPVAVLLPMYCSDYIGGSIFPGPFSDYVCNKANYVSYSGVKKMRSAVNYIQKLQNFILNSYMVNNIALIAKIPADNTKVVVIPSRFAKNISSINLNSLNPQVLLGIKRNKKGIQYLKTRNICLNLKGVHYHIVLPENYVKDNVSWYVQDKDFYDKKLVATGIKLSSAKSNSGYPIFKTLFNINMPSLYAVSSAALYNTKGAMFPAEEGVNTGLSKSVAFFMAPLIMKQIIILEELSETVALIPVIGGFAAAAIKLAEVTYAAKSVAGSVSEIVDENTPIYKYEHAVSGGWDAHLVPLN